LEATVQAQPSADTGGRMLLHVPLSVAAAASRTGAGPREAAGPPGTLSATVTGVHELHLDLQVGGHGAWAPGRLHLCVRAWWRARGGVFVGGRGWVGGTG
jgi:hypothetical protein